MQRRDISLHPSWDRMYAAGMTVQEIADYTHRARSTVHRHLQLRETYSIDLRAVHEAALAARDPGWPNTRWQHRYKAVQDFLHGHDRLPEASGGLEETALGKWVVRQRSLHHNGKLPAIKVTLMDQLPGWDISPRLQQATAHWIERFQQLQTFATEHQRLPRYKHHTTEHEHVLGVWLHTQHQARAEDRLLPWRQQHLDGARDCQTGAASCERLNTVLSLRRASKIQDAVITNE